MEQRLNFLSLSGFGRDVVVAMTTYGFLAGKPKGEQK